jgi:hypothetical protein
MPLSSSWKYDTTLVPVVFCILLGCLGRAPLQNHTWARLACRLPLPVCAHHQTRRPRPPFRIAAGPLSVWLVGVLATDPPPTTESRQLGARRRVRTPSRRTAASGRCARHCAPAPVAAGFHGPNPARLGQEAQFSPFTEDLGPLCSCCRNRRTGWHRCQKAQRGPPGALRSCRRKTRHLNADYASHRCRGRSLGAVGPAPVLCDLARCQGELDCVWEIAA